jgi:glycosyltransferase involved in cell wall biosynthesis
MIVKNEEKIIDRALAWAKPIAYEQIVVDTGSTDRTVEFAEKMGAKVYRFEWINDFSAAKNHAIEQASGNWVAFLDADEYLSPDDAVKLVEVLKHLEENPKNEQTTILKMPWVQLDDNDEVIHISEQTRIFKNIKELRYKGKIHEQITVYGEIMFIDNISIMHTGYAETEYKEKGKAERNINMLRAELVEKPNDINIKAYLADSLTSKIVLDKHCNEDDIAEVDTLYEEVIESDADVTRFLKRKAYLHFLSKIWHDPAKYKDSEKLFNKALQEFPGDLELQYYYAGLLNKMGQYNRAWDILREMESKLTDATHQSTGISAKIISDPKVVFGQALIAAQGLGDIEGVIKYATILLISDKSQKNILGPYIHKLLLHGSAEDEVLGLLGSIYDINSPGDLLLIARTAKEYGDIEFAKIIMTIAGELLES